MNTPTISAAPSVAPSNAGRTQNSGGSEPESTTPFATILTSQRSAEPSREAPAVAPKGQDASAEGTSATGKKDYDAADKHATAEGAEDAALAQAASEQGLTLPQIALTIAAEAAAMQQSSFAATATQAVDSSSRRNPGTPEHLASADDSKGVTKPALASDLPAAGKTGADISFAARSAAVARAAADISVGARGASATQAHDRQPTTNAVPHAGAVQAELPSPAAAPHQTLLSANKAASLAGARQAVLTMQARAQASGDGQIRFPLPEVSAAMASVAHNAAPDTAMTAGAADLAAAQLGSLAASHSTAGASSLPANGLAQLAGHGLQTVQPAVGAPLHSPQWAPELGRQFVSIAQGGHNMPHTAELRLDPPELGPLRITINISDNVAHAVFVSPHAGVRQAVENAMSQLQQSLAQAGISLGQTSVSDQGQSQQAFNESFGNSRRDASGGAVGAAGLDGATPQAAARSRTPDALVDTFA
jgi:flagellar hook-length control protein FliK